MHLLHQMQKNRCRKTMFEIQCKETQAGHRINDSRTNTQDQRTNTEATRAPHARVSGGSELQASRRRQQVSPPPSSRTPPSPTSHASSLWLELLGVGEWNLPQADAVVEGLLCLRPQPAEDGAFDLYHVAPLSLSHHRVLGLVH